jgi:putative acetyltransferase
MCKVTEYCSSHQSGVINTVQTVYNEYGWQWEAEGYHRDLYTISDYYISSGGMFWVALKGERVVGCVGVTIHPPQSELHRLYLLPDYRGRGLGRRLFETAMNFAKEHQCRRMQAWSDVVLKEAHGLYLKNGFVQEGERICSDPDKSREYGFWKEPL